MRQARRQIPATVHHSINGGSVETVKVGLDTPPVAVVSGVESIMGLWWMRSGGYPVGRIFGTVIDA